MNNQMIKNLSKGQDSLVYFVEHIFSQSKSLFPKKFVSGDYVRYICDLLQNNKKTARIGPREHFKSTAFYAHFMHRLIQYPFKNIEAHYFSFNQKMAGYHIKKIRRAIETNPYFYHLIDLKSNSEMVIRYTWDNEHFMSLEPKGLLGFKRGIHSELIYVDDPFQDPGKNMSGGIIEKVNDIFKTQILDMVKDEIHVCGTPQTDYDFFFDNNIMHDFKVSIRPAIIDFNNNIVLWPEWMSYEALMLRKRSKGEKLFAQEYMCAPAMSEESFLQRETLMKCVDNTLLNYKFNQIRESESTIVGGFDIGKKRHPSHFAVFEITGDKWTMIHHKFMDGWDYIKQIEYLQECIDNMSIYKVFYDATRGELESLSEQGILPLELEPITFSAKSKNSLATQLDKLISSGRMKIINDYRLIEQMLLVTNDLQAIETPNGHGDSFWSVALACKFEEEEDLQVHVL